MFYRLLLLLLWCYMTAYSLLHTGVLLAPGSALTLLASQGSILPAVMWPKPALVLPHPHAVS